VDIVMIPVMEVVVYRYVRLATVLLLARMEVVYNNALMIVIWNVLEETVYR